MTGAVEAALAANEKFSPLTFRTWGGLLPELDTVIA